jgi:hypothetical protein
MLFALTVEVLFDLTAEVLSALTAEVLAALTVEVMGLLGFWSGYCGKVYLFGTSPGGSSMLAMGIFPVMPQLNQCLCYWLVASLFGCCEIGFCEPCYCELDFCELVAA